MAKQFGFIKSIEPNGIGFIDAAGFEGGIVLFYIDPATSTKFKVGQRVRYTEAVRAVDIEIDNEELGIKVR
jgi:hypothetical protein